MSSTFMQAADQPLTNRGEDYLFSKEQFTFIEVPQAVRRKILALQRAS